MKAPQSLDDEIIITMQKQGFAPVAIIRPSAPSQQLIFESRDDDSRVRITKTSKGNRIEYEISDEFGTAERATNAVKTTIYNHNKPYAKNGAMNGGPKP
jgi:hypothetical protein